MHFLLVLIVAAVFANSQDWPTDRHDFYRSCSTSAAVTLPLHLQWAYQARFAPSPAWPTEPDSNSYQIRKEYIFPKRPYDWAHRIVSAGGKLFFGSSADEKVYCLDAATGTELWSFFADGPVRFAPTVAGNLVVFGTDGGSAYGLDTATGNQVWRYQPAPSAPRVQGNGRLINLMPIRTDIVVDSVFGYFGSGLDRAATGINWNTINVLTGSGTSVAAREELAFTYEGYGWLDASDTIHHVMGRQGATAGYEYQGANILVGGTRFQGAGSVLAGGSGAWSVTLDGKVYSLAFANGLLFASTSTGWIYCFGPVAKETPDTLTPNFSEDFYANSALAAQYASAAQSILSGSGANRGYALVLGSNEGRLAYELAKQSELNVVCVETDPVLAARARLYLDSCGLYGRVVVQEPARSDSLPYPDFFFDIVTYDGFAASAPFNGPADEAMRVVRPCGGTAFLSPGPAERKGPVIGAGEWTHNLANGANNPNSQDPYVSLDLKLQWFGAPGPEHEVMSHTGPMAPLWKNGVLVVPGENYVTAVNGYNGAILWEKAVPLSVRIPGTPQGGYAVLQDDYLYITSGERCLGLTPREGDERFGFSVPDFGKSYYWGYIAVVDDGADSLLFGGAVHPDMALPGGGGTGLTGHLFALDRHSGTQKWTYTPDSGVILTTTITIAEGKIAFLETTDGNAVYAKFGNLKSLFANQRTAVVALDMRTGALQWRKTRDFSRDSIWISTQASSGRLIVNSTSFDRLDPGPFTEQAYAKISIYVFDMTDGDSLLTTSTLGGYDGHGNVTSHPVVIGDSLYIKSHNQPVIVDLNTGVCTLAPLGEGGPNVQKCGIFSASKNTLYFRGAPGTCCISGPSGWRVDNGWGTYSAAKGKSFMHTSRPGCRINIIPAGGLLSVPEATSDCFCQYALQTSLCFRTAQKNLVTPVEELAQDNPAPGRELCAFNSPNPFNPSTAIRFHTRKDGDYTLKIFDISGKLVRNLASGKARAGLNQAVWDGKNSAGKMAGAGMYYFRLVCGKKTISGKMVFVK